MWCKTIRRALVLVGMAAGLGLAVPAMGRAQAVEGLSAAERRELLRPLYEQVRRDAGLRALEPGRQGRMKDPVAVEAYLRALPISPREYLQLDMQARYYEVMVPRYLEEWHVQWMRYHEAEARKLYGAAYVDAHLSGRYATPVGRGGGEAENQVSLKVGGTDSNLAATATPAPEDYQGEVQIAVNPVDTSQIVAAANTWDDMSGTCAGGIQAIFFTDDGGVTWNYTCAPGASAYAALPACSGTVFGSDPALSWDDANQVFLNYMLLCSTGGSIEFALVVAKSTDGGATWSGQGVIKNSWGTTDIEDKNFYAIDTTTTSPYYGRHYVCWDRNNDEKIAYSSDHGATWTEVDLPDIAGGLDLGCDVAVQKNGKVHVIFDTLTCGLFSCTNERMFYTKSTNGGATWTAALQLRDYNLTGFSGANCPEAQDDRCIGPLGAIDVDRSGGPCNDNLFVTYADFDTGGTVDDTDVWVIRSTDNGATWGAPVRVNDASTGVNSEIQMNPSLAVDQYDGEVVVAWQDARNDPANREVQIYTSTSKDCGLTFGSNLSLTTGAGATAAEWNNNATGFSDENTTDNVKSNPNQYGEYIGLDVKDSKAFVAWTDTRHFYPGFTTESQKENIGVDTRTLLKLGYIKTFKSVGADDGYVLEQSELSSTGGTISSTLTGTSAIRVGDSSTDQEYRGFLSFPTLDIPDAATIVSAKVRLKRGIVLGTSPFSTHGSLTVDVNTAGFSGDLALEAADWQASATATNVCTLPEPAAAGDWTECTFNAAGILAVNKGGRTQVRIHFTTGDNDDGGSDYMGFYGGDSTVDDNRPELVVTYF
jgi:hypothetical protein